MTEIELFDQNNKKIKINNIKVKGTEGNITQENINRLYNNKIHTINDNEMWSMDISKKNIYSQFLNIYLYIYKFKMEKITFLCQCYQFLFHLI